MEFEINPPLGTAFSTWRRGKPVISPDGRFIAFSAQGLVTEQLWVQPLDDVQQPRLLAGSEDGQELFWSPENEQVACTSEDVVRRVDVTGGTATLLTEKFGVGGTWNRAGDVLLSLIWEPIYQTSGVGGGRTPTPLTTLDASRQELWHSSPEFLPDGEHVLFFVTSRDVEHTGTYVASLTSPDSRKLVVAGVSASYAAPGYILFTQEGSLFARSFDLEALEPVGDPTVIVERVAMVEGSGLFSTSSNETLVYRPPFAKNAEFTWFDRADNSLSVLPVPEGAQNPELSPDEEKLAFEVIDPETGWRDIWMWDFDRRVSEKLTTHPGNDSAPVLASDGDSIMFSSSRYGYPSLHRLDVGSSAPPEMIREAQGEDWPMDLSPDGQHVIYATWFGAQWQGKLMLFDLSDDRGPTPLLDNDTQHASGRFSPDGKWVAYVTNESVCNEVYAARSLPQR